MSDRIQITVYELKKNLSRTVFKSFKYSMKIITFQVFMKYQREYDSLEHKILHKMSPLIYSAATTTSNSQRSQQQNNFLGQKIRTHYYTFLVLLRKFCVVSSHNFLPKFVNKKGTYSSNTVRNTQNFDIEKCSMRSCGHSVVQ